MKNSQLSTPALSVSLALALGCGTALAQTQSDGDQAPPPAASAPVANSTVQNEAPADGDRSGSQDRSSAPAENADPNTQSGADGQSDQQSAPEPESPQPERDATSDGPSEPDKTETDRSGAGSSDSTQSDSKPSGSSETGSDTGQQDASKSNAPESGDDAQAPDSDENLTSEPSGQADGDQDSQPDTAQSKTRDKSDTAKAKTAERGPDPWAGPDTWSTFNGDLKAQKYSPATQITPDNVGTLQKAWEVHTGDGSHGDGDRPKTVWSATPLFINDTLYTGTPFYRIMAYAPDTGRLKWSFDPHAVLKGLTQGDLKNRGVAYWQEDKPDSSKACQKIVYIGTMDAKLYGVDADTGKPCASFGKDGMVDVNQWNTVNKKWPLSLLQPPTVYNDTLFVGWAGKDWTDSAAPPGTIFALDARTGALKWTFNALPKDVLDVTGTANVWASMSIDPETGLLYIPVSSPSPNYYGGERKKKLPLATSVTALDTETGKVVWSRQLVHHDIWDYDTDSPPTLVDLTIDDKKVPALIQSSKQGFLYVLNRKTGEPIFPIEERKVPASDVEGEEAAPTQPFVDKPEPVTPDRWPGVSTVADIASFGYCSRTAQKLRYEGRFTPPSLQGTLAYPPTTGGTEWGGGAVDPESGTYVVNSNSVVQIYKLIKKAEYEKQKKNGETSGDFVQGDAPYAFHLETFLNWLGMPCWKPPYGQLAAYDMNTGALKWKKPFGQVQKYGFYMPKSWGSVTIGAPVITKSGLIFIGASMDSRVRAIDLDSGKVLWRSQVDAPAVAMPAVYTYKGKQYVVFAVGGNSILLPKVSDQLVAYTLPGGAQ